MKIKQIPDKFHDDYDRINPVEKRLLRQMLLNKPVTPKMRILIKTGDKFAVLNCREIAYFMYDTGVTIAVTRSDKKYPVDFSVNDLEEQLDPDIFFRINRRYLINVQSIANIYTWFNSRLKLELNPQTEEEVIVSRDRVKALKEWLNR